MKNSPINEIGTSGPRMDKQQQSHFGRYDFLILVTAMAIFIALISATFSTL